MKRPAASQRLAAFMVVVFTAMLAPTADAERLLFMPMGRKLPFGEVRLQHFFGGGQLSTTRTTLGVGFSLLFDGAVTWENGLLGGEEGLSFDLSYNLIAPFTDVNPGFSLGVIDALDRTADGRGIYFASTWRMGMIGDYNQATPLETTIGFMTHRRHSVFVSARFPFTDQFFYIAEYDTKQVVHGLEVRPFRHGSVRLIDRGGTTVWSVGATYRF